MTTTLNVTPQATWAQRVQSDCKASADHNGERWTTDEVRYIAEHTDVERDEDMAKELGRTLFAVWNLQHRLRTEGVEGVLESFAREAAQVRPLSERVYTFIGDDVPPGWND